MLREVLTPRPLDRLALGCVPLTQLPTPDAAVALLEAAFDAGIRRFDTAPAYGRGYSERLLGRFLRRRRESVTITSKAGFMPATAPDLPLTLALGINLARRLASERGQAGGSPPAAGPAPDREAVEATRPRPVPMDVGELNAAFDRSRKSLGVDVIDIYLLHERGPADLTTAARDRMLAMRASGLVSAIGVGAGAAACRGFGDDELEGWDVLQYEAGPGCRNHMELAARFPAQRHILHGAVGPQSRTEGVSPSDALAERMRAFPQADFLFASRRGAHIRANALAAAGLA